MADEQIKPGDTVKLKSGGPGMTVGHGRSGKELECIWFEETKRLEDHFHPDVLEKWDPKKVCI